jgi:hypothetical protein
MHIHIHMLIHSIRHARLMGWNPRFFGTMLFMLLFSMFSLATAEPSSALTAGGESHRCAVGISCSDSIVSLAAPGAASREVDRADPQQPHALDTTAHAGVYSRLKPRIVMIPRMNRVPKPKSVYRLFARAPGNNSDVVE